MVKNYKPKMVSNMVDLKLKNHLFLILKQKKIIHFMTYLGVQRDTFFWLLILITVFKILLRVGIYVYNIPTLPPAPHCAHFPSLSSVTLSFTPQLGKLTSVDQISGSVAFGHLLFLAMLLCNELKKIIFWFCGERKKKTQLTAN